MKLTIIIPAYNEEKTIGRVIAQVAKAPVGKLKKEIIVINDGSTDGTKSQISKLKSQKYKLKVINKRKNEGKGAAIRDAIKAASGDIFIIQDADLEYSPQEYKTVLVPILDGRADVVYGSRFVTTQPRRILYFWHFVANWAITLLADVLTNLNLTDIETCYKAFTKDVARSLDLEEPRFGFDPEFTIKVAKLKARVYEVGISYSGRDYSEGKKIRWWDSIRIAWCLLKYSLCAP